jgi:exodeoxyribonuclease V gamma subunit
VVCLLGMNDGDYPRRTLRTDFDLMARPFMARPGDRSGRDDDRQLMLDALLSSRQQLYMSWAGRSPRDDSEQPPSVLVAQLRDYLAAVWGPAAVEERTTVHPLQPFSRRYFLAGNPQGRSAVFTYAREWREAYRAECASGLAPATTPVVETSGGAAAAADPVAVVPPTAEELARFLQNPVREYFKLRLGVAFPRLDENTPDEEPFVVGGLEGWGLMQDVLRSVETRASHEPLALVSGSVGEWVQEELARLQRGGRLPLGAPGENLRIALQSRLSSMVVRWVQARQAGEYAQLLPSRLCNSKRKLKPEKLLSAWVELLHAGQAGQVSPQRLVAPDGTLLLKPPAAETCAAVLQGLVAARQVGLAGSAPLPTAIKTGLAFLKDSDPGVAYEGNGYEQRGEVEDPCLARLYPDYESLLDAGPSPVEDATSFVYWSQQLYGAFSAWAADQGALEDYAGSEAAVTGGEADD